MICREGSLEELITKLAAHTNWMSSWQTNHARALTCENIQPTRQHLEYRAARRSAPGQAPCQEFPRFSRWSTCDTSRQRNGITPPLEHWFDSHRVSPRIVAEVEDTALLTDLGAQGLGFVPVYSAVLDEIARSSRFQTIGIAKGLRMEIFAITAQRRLQHPGVVAMTVKLE